VFDVGEEASLSYIAMDYVDGESLDFHTTKGKLLSMSEVLTICKHVADALDYAHSRNVIHRDIKPGNIIYNAQTKTVKVTDFGVASLTDDSRTRTGTVLGTPSYMSPEQINGQRVDGRADIFSLGVTLYELLTGTLPFQGDNLSALFNKILHQPPPSLRKTRADTPIALSRLVGRAMRKEPDKRFQTAGELVRALSRLQESIG
jgi:serine/threonine-protein kinase